VKFLLELEMKAFSRNLFTIITVVLLSVVLCLHFIQPSVANPLSFAPYESEGQGDKYASGGAVLKTLPKPNPQAIEEPKAAPTPTQEGGRESKSSGGNSESKGEKQDKKN
jgi:hypothetical protein